MTHAPDIAIIGAGLGGLCLAQGLRSAGVTAAVYERDPSASARAQGYRISLDRRANGALGACLPDKLYQLFEATCGQPSTGVSMFSADGQNLTEEATMRFSQEPRPGLPAAGRAVDRLMLRETLLAELDNTVHFGKEFTHYDLHSTGVEAHFADGSTATCDVLVAADGVSSRVRTQFFPDNHLVDTGMRWLGGRTVLDECLRGLLPEAVADRAMFIKDCGQTFFLAPVFFQQRPNEVARALVPGLEFTDNEDFLMWALVGQQGQFAFTDTQLLDASAPNLHRLALGAVGGCHPMLKALIEAAAPERSFALAIRAVPPLEAWPGSRITFVGDAIHASPINGTGANAALEDAALLYPRLVASKDNLQDALDAYEHELLARVQAMRLGLAQHRAGSMFHL